MSDIRTSFPTTETTAGVGVPLSNVVEGTASATGTAGTANASAVLPAKNSSGDLRYLIVDDAGNLSVSFGAAGTPKKNRGKVPGSGSPTTVCEIPLTAGKKYIGLSWVVSCFRDAVFEFVAIDDPSGTPTEEALADALVGSGDLTDSGDMPGMTFTAGATSPVLRVRAFNLNATSDLRAAVATLESAV